VLALFFLNPEASYYLREVARRLNVSAGTLARELKRFSDEGLLLREARGKEVFYRLNRAHPLYSEIKGIVEKTLGIPVRLAEGLGPIRSIQQALVYGSHAKGNQQATSDIDLLLIGKETPASKGLIKQLERRFGRSINVAVYGPKEFEAKRKNPSEFLYEVMRGPLLQIKPKTPNGSTQAASR
jgi:predicted nucleotidyltransferase